MDDFSLVKFYHCLSIEYLNIEAIHFGFPMQLSVNVDLRWTDTQNFTDLTKPICSGATRNNTLGPGPPGQLERERERGSERVRLRSNT